MSRKGLPKDFKLRHDMHYVEQFVNRAGGTPIGRMIAVDRLTPNPQQPRSDMGNIVDLIASIKEKGVLEPLLVRPSDVGGRFMIIAGERRYRASLEAGLTEVPCIELDVDDRAVAEISLVENLQRKDLNPFEEADGLQALAERFGYTHVEIARKIGKSRTSITETLSLSTIPEDIRELCRRADIAAKSMLLQVVRQPSIDEMRDFVERVVQTGLNREEARRINKERRGKPRGYVYRYTSDKQSFSVVVQFRKSQVKREDVRAALEEALARV